MIEFKGKDEGDPTKRGQIFSFKVVLLAKLKIASHQIVGIRLLKLVFSEHSNFFMFIRNLIVGIVYFSSIKKDIGIIYS